MGLVISSLLYVLLVSTALLLEHAAGNVSVTITCKVAYGHFSVYFLMLVFMICFELEKWDAWICRIYIYF
jgi:hypothetical protein